MFHAVIRWPDAHNKTLWPFAISHAMHLHNHIPRRLDKFVPVEFWSQARSTHTQLVNDHPWGVSVYALDPRLKGCFKTPKFDSRVQKGIHLGPSPLHGSSVGMIFNPKLIELALSFIAFAMTILRVLLAMPTLQKKHVRCWIKWLLHGHERTEMELDPNC